MSVRWPLLVVAALLVLLGGTFALQGAGVLPGQVMHGKPEWLLIGSLMFLVGLGLGFRATRRSRV
jgi:hypothetical protein